MSNVGYPNYPGLAEAAARLNTTIGGKREIDRLPKYLFNGEAVEELAVGGVNNNFGVLVLTDRRILFVFDGWVSANSQEFPLEQVKGIGEEYKGIFKQSEIEVFASTSGRSRKELELEGVDKDDAKRFVATARTKLDKNKPVKSRPSGRTTTSNTPEPAADPMTQLERLGKLHADGVLTDEEFATQKAKILDRM